MVRGPVTSAEKFAIDLDRLAIAKDDVRGALLCVRILSGACISFSVIAFPTPMLPSWLSPLPFVTALRSVLCMSPGVMRGRRHILRYSVIYVHV